MIVGLGSRRVQGWAGSGWCIIRLGSNSFIIGFFSVSLNEIISFHNFYQLGYIRLGYVSRGVSMGPVSYYYYYYFFFLLLFYIYIPWPFPQVWGVADNTKATKTMGVLLLSSSNDERPGRVWMALLEQRSPSSPIFHNLRRFIDAISSTAPTTGLPL